MKVVRLPNNPIVRPDMDARMGRNINGPSLIRVPGWVERPLGRYYLYFAHHKGTYIRLAYADRLDGPWRTHEPGVLDIADSFFAGHIASPDVHVDDARREIRMYYHGPIKGVGQMTRVAVSSDGLRFAAREEVLGAFYFRVFRWNGRHWAIARSGELFRSRDGLAQFEKGPSISDERFRHSAVRLRGDRLDVFYSLVGDCPERILRSTIDLVPDWTAWTLSPPGTVIAPEETWEGADLPHVASVVGWAREPVWELRDPAIHEEDGRTYFVYSVAGEHGLAIAEIVEE